VSSLSACASTQGPVGVVGAERPRAYNRPYEINGHWYRPEAQPGYDVVGTASWYSYESHNRTTSDGEVFDARLPTAAHKTLPIPSYLEVTNLENGRRLRVRLNDRGPFVAGRIIDLTRGAAAQLGFLEQGTARVRVRYLGPAPLRAGEGITTARLSAVSPDGDE
jgi:rare lipoprotein A